MRQFLLFGFLLSSLFTQGQSEQGLGDVWVWGGSIHTYPVTLYLEKSGPSISGSYYYNKIQRSISLSGEDTSRPGKIILRVYADKNPETFELENRGDSIVGTWQSGKSQWPVVLRPVAGMHSIRLYALKASRPLYDKNPEGPSSEIDLSAVWPTDNRASSEFIRRIIRKTLTTEKWSGTPDPRQIMEKRAKDQFDAYKKQFADVSQKDAADMGGMYSESYIQHIGLMYLTDSFVCLRSMNYEYTGGAHGSGYSQFLNLDLVRQKELGLTDLVTPAGMKRLPQLLEQQFRADRGLKPGQSLREAGLFENRIAKPAQNVYLTGKGIGFVYTVYEIGPYSSGEIEIFIPATRLRSLLTPRGLALLK